MVLNLLRVEEINPEYMLEKSFYQFQHYRALPGVVDSKCTVTFAVSAFLFICFETTLLILAPAEIKKYEEQYHTIEIPNQESVVTYFKIRQQLAKLGKEIQEFIHRPKYCLPFLQPGRLVKVEPLSLAPSSPRRYSRSHVFSPQVKNEDADFGWGVVVNFNKKTNVKVSGDFWCENTRRPV